MDSYTVKPTKQLTKQIALDTKTIDIDPTDTKTIDIDIDKNYKFYTHILLHMIRILKDCYLNVRNGIQIVTM